jgi:hypothetical protein
VDGASNQAELHEVLQFDVLPGGMNMKSKHEEFCKERLYLKNVSPRTIGSSHAG